MNRPTPLAVGQSAPAFSLPSSLGKRVALADALGAGPVVLVWYVFDFGAV
jgi:peroxiredoxin